MITLPASSPLSTTRLSIDIVTIRNPEAVTAAQGDVRLLYHYGTAFFAKQEIIFPMTPWTSVQRPPGLITTF